MFGSEWIFDSHTILMIVLLIVSVIYLIQNSNDSNESQSKQLVPIKKRKRSRKEINETKNIIVVKGAVPGFNNSFILIEK